MLSSTKQQGFTLIELLVATVGFGIISVAAAAAWMHYVGVAQVLNEEARFNDHVAVKEALLDFSANENNGRLPVVFTGGGYNSTCIDVSNAVLKSYLSQYTYKSVNIVNEDDSIERNVKTCQQVRGVTKNHSIAGFGGPTITLTYDVGVVYQTKCSFNDSTCNTGTPGDSATYAATGWSTSGDDDLPVEFSTLSIQEAKWDRTYANLLEMRTIMMNHRIDMVRTNAADDTTNWNIAPNLGASPDLSGASAATNQGCYDGWYDLSDTDVNTLVLYGLNQGIYGITDFGGRVEFCRDYDPADGGAATAPHLAALRVNIDVSNGTAPDAATIANNLIISF